MLLGLPAQRVPHVLISAKHQEAVTEWVSVTKWRKFWRGKSGLHLVPAGTSAGLMVKLEVWAATRVSAESARASLWVSILTRDWEKIDAPVRK